jgi:chromate transport protein ChrA
MTEPGLGQVTRAFLRIGNTTFGGGDTTQAALQREFVHRREWITHDDYAVAFSLARITPGTNAVAFCAAIGARIAGVRGAVAAVLAETVPSAAIAVMITWGYEAWRSNRFVLAAILGASAAVSGMMFASVWLLLRPRLRMSWRTVRPVALFAAAFIAAWKFGVTPLPIIAIAAVAGFAWSGE